MCTNDVDHVIITIETEKPVPSMDEDLQGQLQHRRQGEVTIYSNRTIADNPHLLQLYCICTNFRGM